MGHDLFTFFPDWMGGVCFWSIIHLPGCWEVKYSCVLRPLDVVCPFFKGIKGVLAVETRAHSRDGFSVS